MLKIILLGLSLSLVSCSSTTAQNDNKDFLDNTLEARIMEAQKYDSLHIKEKKYQDEISDRVQMISNEILKRKYVVKVNEGRGNEVYEIRVYLLNISQNDFKINDKNELTPQTTASNVIMSISYIKDKFTQEELIKKVEIAFKSLSSRIDNNKDMDYTLYVTI